MDDSVLGLLDISVSGLLSSFIFGVIGIYVFRYGRKVSDYRFLGIGIALMFYPYFTKGVFLDWGVGVALCGLGYYWKNN